MKNKLQAVSHYISEHKQTIGTTAMAVIGVVVLVGLFIYNQPHGPKIVYQPVKACDILTPAKAMDALGDKIIGTDLNKPTIDGNLALSKCGYTDKNIDQNQMAEVSIAVQSAINDKGIAQNNADFKTRKSQATHIEEVTGLGDSAYYDKDAGLLQVLNGKQWLMISYGNGQTIVPKPLAETVALAQKILK